MCAARRLRIKRDDGVAVVEFALVLPVLMIMLLGMFSGAIAWNNNMALAQGARVSARYASTLPLPSSPDATTMAPWLDDIADRAVQASEGRMAAGVTGRVVCVAFVHPDAQTFSRTMDSSGTRTSGTAPCFADGQAASNKRVQVVLEREGVLDTGFYRQTLTLRREVVYRYEADGGL